MTLDDFYRARFLKALDHVDGNLDGDLSVERLASVAAFSKFHFHRQFAAVFGLGVHEYVRLARLRSASYELAFRPSRTVLETALGSGYESPEAFARAFKKLVGQTPSEFRQDPDFLSLDAAERPLSEVRRQMTRIETNAPVTLVDFPETKIALLAHRGDPRLIGETIRRFIEWRRANGLHPSISATYNFLYTDPKTTPPEQFRLDLCCATNSPVAPNDFGVVDGVIAAGRCAMYRIVGSDAHFEPVFRYLYGEWLPKSGEEPRDFPLFVQRVKMFPDVSENESVTDVFLPIA